MTTVQPRSWYFIHTDVKERMETSPFGSMRYFLGNKLHRDTGPAVEQPDGHKEYWLYGKQVSAVEHFVRMGVSLGLVSEWSDDKESHNTSEI